MTKEKLIARIMKECAKEGEPVTKEEAEEMAEMEIKAGGLRRYEKSDTPRKPANRERKVDEVKKDILDRCREALECDTEYYNFSEKNEVELTFFFNEDCYTLKLIKHRKAKGD